MFIPIVRRTITVRVRETFRFPFQCDVCHLATWASAYAEGIGSATMAYMRPDENAARMRAHQSAHATAAGSFAQSPCPRCGGHSAAARARYQAWEQRVVSRKQVRFYILIAGIALSVLSSGGCAVAVYASDPSDPGSAGAAVVLSVLWMFLAMGITGIAYWIAGPGARPLLMPYVPPNVRFDPPDPSQVQVGGYRAPY